LTWAHYVVASFIWRAFYRQKEKEGVAEDDDSISHSDWLEVPIWLLFVIKIVFVAAAYVLLFSFLWTHISSGNPAPHFSVPRFW
jgi:type VI protein secretion system component VasF